jgi:hypothetical protein
MSFGYAKEQIVVLGSDLIAVIDRHKKIPFFFIIARASPFCQWKKDQNLIFCASFTMM